MTRMMMMMMIVVGLIVLVSRAKLWTGICDGNTCRTWSNKQAQCCSVQSADALARGTKKQQSRSESSNLFCLAGQCACAKEHAILNVGPQE